MRELMFVKCAHERHRHLVLPDDAFECVRTIPAVER